MRRTLCACGRPIVVPEPDTQDLLMWAIRAHNESEWHRRWADRLVEPELPVPSRPLAVGPVRLSREHLSPAELRGRR